MTLREEPQVRMADRTRKAAGNEAASSERRKTSPVPHSRNGTGGIADFLVKFVLLATPVCYALGRVYAEGYWGELGISPTAMARPFEDYVFFSFVMLANAVAWAFSKSNEVSFLAALSAIVLLIGLFSTLAWLLNYSGNRLRPELRRFAVKLRRWARQRKSFMRALSAGAAAYDVVNTAVLVFLVASLVLLVPLASAHWLGKNQAERLRERLRANGRAHEWVVAKNGDETVRGRLIECTERRCVLFTKGKFVPVPAESVRWEAGTQAGDSVTEQ